MAVGISIGFPMKEATKAVINSMVTPASFRMNLLSLNACGSMDSVKRNWKKEIRWSIRRRCYKYLGQELFHCKDSYAGDGFIVMMGKLGWNLVVANMYVPQNPREAETLGQFRDYY
ncbi:hypothetical protein Tco_1280555 [Tanacetum coccineum]